MARHLINALVEALAILESIAFNLPELVRFNADGFHTFHDIDPTAFFDEVDKFINCTSLVLTCKMPV